MADSKATSVDRTIHIDASPHTVWRLLSTPAGLTQWYAFDGAHIEPHPGGRIEFFWTEHGTFTGEILEASPPHTLRYRICALPDTPPDATNSTEVTITVEPAGAGVIVRVTQTGFEQLSPEAAEVSTAEVEDGGWTVALDLLKNASAEPSA
jgi:uncharacterized protein YndB with AHSA1/START domain